MALVKCPDCAAPCSNRAPACPKCGRPLDRQKTASKGLGCGWPIYTIMLVGGAVRVSMGNMDGWLFVVGAIALILTAGVKRG